MLMLIVGPSGAGKDTLLNAARKMLRDDNRFRFARRAITRAADVGGEDHEPVDAASFALRRAAGAYALTWEAHGLHYGISAEIGLELAADRVVVASVSRSVVAEAAHRYPVGVIEITAPPELLSERLTSRGREGPGDIAERLARQVDIEEELERVTIVNNGTIDEGARRLVAELLRVADMTFG
jgi:phosphonate metabolism protein PhnN/1,5-bisphosphokinase (PRPP-forming)